MAERAPWCTGRAAAATAALSWSLLLLFFLALSPGVDCATHYQVLEVEKDANSSEVKKSFRRLSLLYHPDKNPSADAAQKFNEIANAYEVLSDEGKRAEYDESLEMMFADLTTDFGSFLKLAAKWLSDLWEEAKEDLQTPFSQVMCMGLDVSVFEMVLPIFESFVSDDDNRASVTVQYPGLAVGEKISQLWLQRSQCGVATRKVVGLPEKSPWEALLPAAAASLFWYLRGRTLFWGALAYILLLANLPDGFHLAYYKGSQLVLLDWVSSLHVPAILSMGYLLYLQVALVFLCALPFHVLHRFLVGSLLTGAVSVAVSTALLSIWLPAIVLPKLGAGLLKPAMAALALYAGSQFPLDVVKRPCRSAGGVLLWLWLWLPVTSAKVAEGLVLLPFGVAPFTHHPYWMRWLMWASVQVFHRAPLWCLDKWGHLVSYVVISCMLYLVASQYMESLAQLPFLVGLATSFGAAALLWVLRSRAASAGLVPS